MTEVSVLGTGNHVSRGVVGPVEPVGSFCSLHSGNMQPEHLPLYAHLRGEVSRCWDPVRAIGAVTATVIGRVSLETYQQRASTGFGL